MDLRRMFSHKLLLNAIDRIKSRFADRLRLNPAPPVIPRCAGILRAAGKVWETIRDQPMSQPTKQLYEFGPFRLDPVERLLCRDGEVVTLTAKIFDILLVFVRNSGRTLDKEEVMREVWPDQLVEEGNLTRNVSTLRKALGESRDDLRYIVTISGRGYRFVADVREAQAEDAKPSGVKGDRSDVRRPARRTVIWSLAACVALAALTAAGFYALRPNRSNATENEMAISSIAALPFKRLGAEGDDEYFGLGMADSLITKLSNFKKIVVRPTSAARRYAGRDQDPVAAGRERTRRSRGSPGLAKNGTSKT
jgi:DNA-binding winged helix-turn-helix (wHTH) protein